MEKTISERFVPASGRSSPSALDFPAFYRAFYRMISEAATANSQFPFAVSFS